MAENQILKFDIDEITILQEISDSQLAIAEIYVCCDGMNAHELPISLDAIQKAIPSLINKWLVAGFDGEDFKGHEGKSQLIIGHFPKENDFRFEEKNGKNYLVANVILSKIYASWAIDIFKEKNFKECSMEITVLERELRDDGYEWIISFVFNGVTVLGNSRRAACPGSNVQITEFSSEEFIESTEKAYMEFMDKTSVKNNEEGGNSKMSKQKKDEKINFSLNSDQIRELMCNFLSEYKYKDGDYEWTKYYVEAYDDTFVYVWDCEVRKTFGMTYTLNETSVTIDINSAFEVIRGNYVRVDSIEPDPITMSDSEKKSQMVEYCSNMKYSFEDQELCKYSYVSSDDTYMYCMDMESEKLMAVPYSIEKCEEEMKLTCDFSSAKYAKINCEVDKEQNFSIDVLNFMSKKKEIEEGGLDMSDTKNFEVELDELKEKMNTLENENSELKGKVETFESENKDLKTFKENVETDARNAKIEFAINEVSDILTQEQIDEWKGKVAEYENVEMFSNAIQAFAFSITKGIKPNKEDVVRMSCWQGDSNNENKTNKSIWED